MARERSILIAGWPICRMGPGLLPVAFASTHAIDVEAWQDVEDASHPQLM